MLFPSRHQFLPHLVSHSHSPYFEQITLRQPAESQDGRFRRVAASREKSSESARPTRSPYLYGCPGGERRTRAFRLAGGHAGRPQFVRVFKRAVSISRAGGEFPRQGEPYLSATISADAKRERPRGREHGIQSADKMGNEEGRRERPGGPAARGGAGDNRVRRQFNDPAARSRRPGPLFFPSVARHPLRFLASLAEPRGRRDADSSDLGRAPVAREEDIPAPDDIADTIRLGMRLGGSARLFAPLLAYRWPAPANWMRYSSPGRLGMLACNLGSTLPDWSRLVYLELRSGITVG